MSKEFKIGLIVTSAIFMLYWGANFLSGNNVFNPQVEYFVKYKNLDGLQASNDVRYEGAKIGLVSDVIFDKKATDGYWWVVRFSIKREGVELMDSTIAEVGSADLLGTMILDLKKINSGAEPLNSSDTLIGVMSESLSDLVTGQIAPLKAKTDELLGTINTLVVSLQGVLDSTTQVSLKNSFAAIPKAIRSIAHATESLDTIVDELKRARIASIVTNLTSITDNLKNNNATITSMITNLDNITDSLAKANVKGTIDRVNNVLNEATSVLEGINNGEGTVGMLLNDKQLYENIILATADLDFLLMDLKQNPGRYLNISMFNFGSKRKKEAIARDSTEYNQFFKNALLKAGLTEGKDERSQELLKELSDSCTTGCDSVKLKLILKKYSN